MTEEDVEEEVEEEKKSPAKEKVTIFDLVKKG